MDDEYKLISAKLLELELRGNITQQEKATLASAISRILDEAIRKRDALAVVKIQRMGARLAVLKLEHPHDFKVPHYSASQFKLKNQEGKEKQKVFIVHGRNDEMKQAVTRVVERLGLAPVILSEKQNLGRAIIEKFIENAKVNYAIVLLSPDDMGYLKVAGSDQARPRARQNVIFEFGYFLGRIQRENVAVIYLVTDEFEFPSDFLGGAYIPYDENEAWKLRLVGELKASGFDVDANDLLNIP